MKELSLTTDLMFNRILAKSNFKYEDEETAKEEITKMLSDTNLTVVESRCKAIEMVNPDKSLEVQKSIIAEGYLFLKNEYAISMQLIQYNAYGTMKFAYVVKSITI